MAAKSRVRDPFIAMGCTLGGAGILLDALLSHLLSSSLSEKTAALFEQAIEYQLYHALALVLCGLLARLENTLSVRLGGWLFVAGIVLFCGGLYFYAIFGQPQIKSVIPIGGALLVIAWAVLALSFIGHTRRRTMNDKAR